MANQVHTGVDQPSEPRPWHRTILDVLGVLHRDRLALGIHEGAFSAMALTARHPRTGQLLSTVKFMVHALAAGELRARTSAGADVRRAGGR